MQPLPTRMDRGCSTADLDISTVVISSVVNATAEFLLLAQASTTSNSAGTNAALAQKPFQLKHGMMACQVLLLPACYYLPMNQQQMAWPGEWSLLVQAL